MGGAVVVGVAEADQTDAVEGVEGVFHRPDVLLDAAVGIGGPAARGRLGGVAFDLESVGGGGPADAGIARDGDLHAARKRRKVLEERPTAIGSADPHVPFRGGVLGEIAGEGRVGALDAGPGKRSNDVEAVGGVAGADADVAGVVDGHVGLEGVGAHEAELDGAGSVGLGGVEGGDAVGQLRETIPVGGTVVGFDHPVEGVGGADRAEGAVVEDLELVGHVQRGTRGGGADAHVAGGDHTWNLDLPEVPVQVTGDALRLHQVLANLLANARTHTPAGTTVRTAVTVDDGRAVLTVTDNGPGISPELQSQVFERFTRADSSRVRKQGGSSTGLGLAIVAAVVAAHRGTASVQSEPGHTVFTVTLPIAPAPSAG